MPIVSISLPEKILDLIDKVMDEHGYTSRSELVREAIREYVMQRFSEEYADERMYSILIVLTNHELKPSSDQRVINTIHDFQALVRSFYHQILENGWCLNIVVLDSTWREIIALTKMLRRIKGVENIWFIPIRIVKNA